MDGVFPEQVNHGIDLSGLSDTSVFVPVLPLFDESQNSDPNSNSLSNSSKIPPVYFTSFLSEQARTYEEKKKEIAKIFPTNDKLITQIEAQIIVNIRHIVHVCEAFSEGVDYIENLLQKQLVSAIGKRVTSADFTEYLNFHNRKIYKEEYRPQAFCYSIRRPDHYPEVFLNLIFIIIICAIY